MINLLRDSDFFCFIIKIVPILNWLEMVFVTTNQIMPTAILMVVIAQQQLQIQQQALQFQLQALSQIQQQLEDVTRDGLGMHIVMISITTLTVTMMVVTVVDVMSTHNTAQCANALIQMEAMVKQLVHKQQQLLLQPSQLFQQLMIQVNKFVALPLTLL
jgi:hypothetical protein